MANEFVQAIENIGGAFDEFKKVNDQRLEELNKGNEARARELDEKLGRIETEIVSETRKKKELEQRLAVQQDRIEILEALNDRPKGTIQDKIRTEHRELFMEWMRKGGNAPEVDAKYQQLLVKAREVKDVVLGTVAAGGYALPEEIGATIDKLMLRRSEILGEVRNVVVGSSDYKELVTIHGGTSGWVGETGSRSATGTPNLRERAPTWGEMYAYPQVSEWALQDIMFNVEEWLVNDIADGMAVALSTAIYNGNGTAKPTGVFNGAAVTTADYASPMRAAAVIQYIPLASETSPETYGMDTLFDLVYSLNPAYRSNAKFGMNTVTQGATRKLKSSDGVYHWQPSLQMGQPDRLMGYPVFTWEDLGNSSAANAYAVTFGDHRRGYLMCTRTSFAVTRDNVTNPGYQRFYVRRRYGGCVLNNDAIKVLKVAVT